MSVGELDPQLLARARAGEPAAFRALYEHHADAVFGFLCRLLRDEAAAEDALQDVFMRVLGAIGRFDPGGRARLRTWIFVIARRVALNALARTRGAQQAAAAGAPPASGQPRPELRLAIDRAVATLAPALRTTFVLFAGCGFSYEEVAEVEEVDLGTVKSRLHRARAALQVALQEDDDAEHDADDHGRSHEARASR
jgi:RNA polymerase sigma-70 factor, ECF subfamily